MDDRKIIEIILMWYDRSNYQDRPGHRTDKDRRSISSDPIAGPHWLEIDSS